MLSPEIRKKIRSIEIRTSRMVSDVLAGQYRSAFKGRGMEFEEVRPYMFGDDVRSIDWNVSARAGEPHVKVFREERELTVMLAVDLSRSLAMGTRSELKRELVAEIAATLAFSAIRSNDRVGMLLFTDRIEAIVPPKKGARHVLRIVRDLLAFTPQGRGTDIARALDELNASLSKRTVVCVISDFLAPAQAKPWEGALARLRRRHDVIPIIVTDARERELPDVGIIDLEDLETGEVRAYDSSSRWVREGWAEVAEDRAQTRDRLFRKAKTEPLLLETGVDFLAPLRAYFSRREARRSR
ncbi:MAG: DUF58 domain-containing protein [Planctomycetota bacterium]|jgi:uncharacterized protein (DUF58 family)|nr:MAG: DUF58 domain-containing protein [Planctomycetota bacterium]RLS99411.1 MAG: DUF58 domain-containing protein [Planctomycetota bacterium]